ncbi:MAG: crossover junction endodeoxyribonuclease RuvC [Alphaproteobacteria bacterium]|nr:crossover junction endodeoxyribonuclease RuvC [Alphaproteobacteria bacterium]MBQ9235670.1 crossover junction endodeoxyribonuclease RuvC [Alphaproteobacteria bacterium]
MRILGLDPSLSSTGWGVIETENNRVHYVADGFIPTEPKLPIAERLTLINETLRKVIETYKPNEAAIEQVFLNANPSSTMRLCMARGVVIMTPAQYGISVTEYEPNKVKKAVVGVGKAAKNQVETMVKILLPGCKPKNNDASDALAIALCHFQYRRDYGLKK